MAVFSVIQQFDKEHVIARDYVGVEETTCNFLRKMATCFDRTPTPIAKALDYLPFRLAPATNCPRTARKRAATTPSRA
jgi:hypothetical protein